MLKVGDKVICVDDSIKEYDFPNFPYCIARQMPVKGGIYTISAIGLTHSQDKMKLPCIHVEELDRNDPLWLHRFRPVYSNPEVSLEDRITNLEKAVFAR